MQDAIVTDLTPSITLEMNKKISENTGDLSLEIYLYLNLFVVMRH